MRIVIDPGHGGHDPGAVNLEVGAQEKDINLAVATALHQALIWAGHASRMTRDGDHGLELSGRVALARVHKAEAFVSIHCNAAANREARGMELWTSPGRTPADDLATAIGLELGRCFQGKNTAASAIRRDDSDGDLDKEGRLYVLTMTSCPAVLIECGFISNDDEGRRLQDPGRQQAIAEAIARGISKWGGAA